MGNNLVIFVFVCAGEDYMSVCNMSLTEVYKSGAS